jgi:predicted transporter
MKIGLATFALLAVPRLALACPVCFGGPDSPQTRAAQMGILALLVVTVGMLASIAGFFFVYLRRRMRLFEESNKRELLDA